MSHAFVTIVAKVQSQNIAPVRALIADLGNRARLDVSAALDAMNCIHFVSLNVFEASSGDGGHLTFEFSGDGAQEDLLKLFEDKLGGELRSIFAKAEGFSSGQSLADFWQSHAHTMGSGYFETVGLVFTGTPGMTVDRIRKERQLQRQLATIVSNIPRRGSALSMLGEARQRLKAAGGFDWAFNAEPTPLLGEQKPYAKAILSAVWSALTSILWPLLLAILIGIFLPLVLAIALGILGILVAKFLTLEQTDIPEDHTPSEELMRELLLAENQAAQNHLSVFSPMKPGWLRKFALRLTFFAIGQLATNYFRPGYLGGINTIHFARWILVPGTDDLLFFSNYGGSWESYLEDFITKAHAGLTAVWSNTLQFPRAQLLAQQGATDGDRFKRWARNHQVLTPFWYTAYPDLTTANIRSNAAIRQGLSGAMTEDEARHWLSLFGSAPQAANELEAAEIQSLLFGGFAYLHHAVCLLFRLKNGDPAMSKKWLAGLVPQISTGESKHEQQGVVIAGFAASALSKFDLPERAVATFPSAFLHPADAPWRARVRGDEGRNGPENWWWGSSDAQVDGVLLLYAKEEALLAGLKGKVKSELEACSHTVVREISMDSIKTDPDTKLRIATKEPFGFTDGVSQPVMRGTFRERRGVEPMHLVQPGEFILGYPDNRGYFPPSPNLPAQLDPENKLALLPDALDPALGFSQPAGDLPHDLGRNGTFLVIRQLEQEVDAFDKFAEEAAAKIGPGTSKEWVEAKFVGRWKDGSSLVRNPNLPASDVNPNARPDNAFLYGKEDPQATRCPFGAHIRRSTPRDSFDPGSQEQVDINNRHRIIRAGRQYKPEQGQKKGLLFMCLNADIERQFEFVQQTWSINPRFHGLSGEGDPLLAGGTADACFTIPTRVGPIRVTGMQDFVTVRGNGYFFLPGKRTLEYLAAPAIT